MRDVSRGRGVLDLKTSSKHGAAEADVNWWDRKICPGRTLLDMFLTSTTRVERRTAELERSMPFCQDLELRIERSLLVDELFSFSRDLHASAAREKKATFSQEYSYYLQVLAASFASRFRTQPTGRLTSLFVCNCSRLTQFTQV